MIVEQLDFEVRNTGLNAALGVRSLTSALTGLRRVSTPTSIQKITTSLQGLSDSLRNMDFSRLNEMSQSLSNISNMSGIGRLQKDLVGLDAELGRKPKDCAKASSGLRGIGDSAKKATGGIGKLAASLGRIAFYRLIRTIVKHITDAFKVGLEHVYKFSSTINGTLAQALDSISSKSLVMKNQLGAALGELLTTIAPIINTLAGVVTKIADAFSRLFAVLGGRSTYNKATESTAKWADAAGSAAKAAKEWKNQLLGFDEINRLEEPTDSTSGGGSSSTDNIGNFAETAVTGFQYLKDLMAMTKEWWNGLNLEPIIESWNRLKEAVSGFIRIVGDGFKWVYQNILLPFAGWVIEDYVPARIELLASAFEFLNAVLHRLAPYVKELWNNILEPFAAWLGDKLISAINWVSDGFKSLTEKVEKAKNFGEFLSSLDGKEKFMLSIAAAIVTVITAIGILKTASSVISTVGAIIGALKSPIGIAVLAITTLVAAGIWLYNNWDEIGAKIKEIWGSVTSWIGDKVDWIVGKFRAFADWCSNIFSNIAEFFGFSQGVADSVSSITGGVKGYASGGYPATGELFVAREAGPELVGTIGGATAVANNSDIVAGIREGVYEATLAAINNGNLPTAADVRDSKSNFYLDGAMIRKSLNNYARTVGA